MHTPSLLRPTPLPAPGFDKAVEECSELLRFQPRTTPSCQSPQTHQPLACVRRVPHVALRRLAEHARHAAVRLRSRRTDSHSLSQARSPHTDRANAARVRRQMLLYMARATVGPQTPPSYAMGYALTLTLTLTRRSRRRRSSPTKRAAPRPRRASRRASPASRRAPSAAAAS